MYTSFRIQNFRCFEDLQLDDLARVNLIAGKNNTGKTSILDAIATHTGAIQPSQLLRTPTNQGSDRLRNRLGVPVYSAWNTVFRNFDTENPIALIAYTRDPHQMTLFDTDPLKRTVEISLGELSQAEDRVYRILRPLLRDYELENASDLDIFVLSLSYPQGTFYMLQYEGRALSDSLPMLFPTTYISAREGLRMGAIADHFSMLKRLKKDYLLTDVMRIIEPRLISLELLSESGAPIIHGYVGLKEPVPLNAMGEGMGRAAGLVLAIASNGGGIVIIDEIENGLHYSVMSDVWKAIHKAAVEFDVQIFATTHSFEMIRAANEAFSDSAPDDFRYLRLDRSQSGQIKVVTYDEESLDSSLESNLEVR